MSRMTEGVISDGERFVSWDFGAEPSHAAMIFGRNENGVFHVESEFMGQEAVDRYEQVIQLIAAHRFIEECWFLFTRSK